jgi:hypothetical protein
VRTVVSRRIFLKSRAGEEFERPESRTLFEGTLERSGEGVRIASLRPKSCNEAEAEIQRDVERARASAAAALDEVVTKDREEVRALFAGREGVRRAVVEAEPPTER